MNIGARLRSFNARQLLKLALLFGRKPTYIFPTLKATKEALHIAGVEFGNRHSKNNRANAFRHALWTVLLGQLVYAKNKNLDAAKDWAKKVTDLHENLAVNKPLERAMDLHNNAVGIAALKDLVTASREDTVYFLKEKALKGRQVNDPGELEQHPNQLVYITS